ncbi:hypothetical protein MKX08_000108 [Trichoderma sp. CBMAI-0020]|nr:hypothetical protein MKX08_000108 [Trichoderma sp. CBMAI-0020]
MATFGWTRDSIQEILRTESYFAKAGVAGSPQEIDVFSFERERKERARSWCIDLSKQLTDPTCHVRVLDEWYSKLVKCHFQPSQDEQDIITQVGGVLKRIPQFAPEFHDALVDQPYCTLDREYFLPGSEPSWESLHVAHVVSRNVLRIAIQIQIVLGGESNYADHFRTFLNVTAEVLAELISLSHEEPRAQWFVMKAYFWTSWQRATNLYHYYVLNEQLSWGYDTHRDISTPLEGSDITKMVQRLNQSKAESCYSPYMCKWALRLLHEDKAIIGQDYRRFNDRFSQTFPDSKPRCIISDQGQPTACDGRQPGKCLRLSGMRIENQSAHAPDCTGTCSTLYWNEESWKRIGGAAAVSLDLSTAGELNYVEASGDTIAVSHVWSHGQGGRPEDDVTKGGTGLNSCLHRRYSKIAKLYGCNSYWMDTPCIPSNHVLRGKAIANINTIFATSKLTVVCDKDLMAIDFQPEDIACKEAIIAAVLVCDWNVRAWTLLEALRGRHNLHVLCKGDVVVSLKDTLRDVCSQGCIEIAALFLSAQHLLPSQSYVHGLGEDHPSQSSQWIVKRRKGFVDIKEAAGLLSHRHASRAGDEIVIWGLLTGDKVFDKAESLWLSQQGRGVPSGWLVSSYERLTGVKGFSWAPSRPNFRLHGQGSHADYNRLLFPYSGIDTRISIITSNGLRGDWWAYMFRVRRGFTALFPQAFAKASCPLEKAAAAYVDSEKWCALLVPLHAWQRDRWVPHPRRQSQPVFAVVASGDGRVWKWKGLLEVDHDVILPQFKTMEFLIE